MDIENVALDAEQPLACVGFAPSPDAAWVVPAGAPWQLDAIRDLCEAPTLKVLQNGQYDRFFLRWFSDIDLRGQVFDTMLGWHALQPELAGKKTPDAKKKASRQTVKSLGFLASILSREPHWKNYEFATSDDRYRLCGTDCCVTLEIGQTLARMLEAT